MAEGLADTSAQLEAVAVESPQSGWKNAYLRVVAQRARVGWSIRKWQKNCRLPLDGASAPEQGRLKFPLLSTRKYYSNRRARWAVNSKC